jgi:hypothetical protein
VKRLSVLLAAALAALASLPARAFEATVVTGVDRATIRPPAGVQVEPYQNAGYRLLLSNDGTASVEVDLRPLETHVPFSLPREIHGGAVESVARAVAAGAQDRYDAVGRLLGWVAGNVGYDLDRRADQSPEAVLARRTAFCTGTARLSVALLAAVGIEAREVPGYVVETVPGGPPRGFHRWIEVYYPDRGWVFSDPMVSHHFVASTYLRLADDRVAAPPGNGRLLFREELAEPIDIAATPAPARALRIRPNEASRRTAAALVVRLEPSVGGSAVLEGGGIRRTLELPEGHGVFVGLEPGEYELRVETGGRLAAWKKLTFRDRILAELPVPVETGSGEGVSRR